MNNLISKIQSKFEAETLRREKHQVWFKVDKNNLTDVCNFLKDNGFEFFSSLTAVDVLEKNLIELIYHLWSQKRKSGLNLKIEIDREHPKVSSISEIYNASQIHEREIHELFGVNFLGNQNLSELFLENWQGPAPFLKDFDWRKYVREKFYNKEKQNEKGYF